MFNTSKLSKSLPPFLKPGLLAGLLCCLAALLGMVKAFADHDIIAGVFSLGQLILAIVIFAFATFAIRAANSSNARWLAAILVGAMASFSLLLLVALLQVVNLRDYLVNASPELGRILLFNQPSPLGYGLLMLFGVGVGALAALLHSLPQVWRAAIQNGLLAVMAFGVFRELILLTIGQSIGWAVEWLYFGAESGLSVFGAVLVFLLTAGWRYWQVRNDWSLQAALGKLPKQQQKNVNLVGWGLAAGALLGLPWLLGPVFSEVATTVGLFILMGLGLNIVVGFAGLLDLGYVAFYAIGAYVVGVLTSTSGQLAFAPQLNFWVVLPIALLTAVLAGIVLGIPVLKVHGDYLAIVTLGFGEIIRILALSDVLKPYIGGAQGIVAIPPISIFGFALDSAQKLYYLVLLCVLLAALVAWRLRSSRVGRTWMAMREDEDVAEAMGISLIRTKLLAFAAGAFFSGLSGAIFATKLQTIYPSSFALLISINVLALIIIGGLGSIPGVLVGALVLVGLPELLREFSEYRLLLYGIALVLMMLYRPEGLWPATVQHRELQNPRSSSEAI